MRASGARHGSTPSRSACRGRPGRKDRRVTRVVRGHRAGLDRLGRRARLAPRGRRGRANGQFVGLFLGGTALRRRVGGQLLQLLFDASGFLEFGNRSVLSLYQSADCSGPVLMQYDVQQPFEQTAYLFDGTFYYPSPSGADVSANSQDIGLRALEPTARLRRRTDAVAPPPKA